MTERSRAEIHIPSSEEAVTQNQNYEARLHKMLDNPIFPACLLILAGISIAFQAGKETYK
jgi:hypothetical protein